MKNYTIFKKNFSIVLVIFMLFSSIPLMVFSQETKAGGINPITLPPYIDRKIDVSESEYEFGFNNFPFGSYALFYIGEIIDFENDLDQCRVEIIISSVLRNPFNLEITDEMENRFKNSEAKYKLAYNGVFYTDNVKFEDEKIFVYDVIELNFATPRFQISGFIDSDDYAFIKGYDTQKSHWVHINAPQDNEDQEITPGYYGYKVHFISEYGFGGLTAGINDYDIYICFGYKLDELEDDPSDDDDDTGDDDDDDTGDDNDEILTVDRPVLSNLINSFFSKFSIISKIIERFFNL